MYLTKLEKMKLLSLLIKIKLSFFLLSFFLLNLGCKKEDILGPISNGISIPQKTSSTTNNFQLKSVNNLVIFNKSITQTNPKNVFSTDSNGNLVSLVIPDAKNYNLNINYLIKCSPKYFYLNGSLNVEYLNGNKESYSNFILDIETGYFYQLLSDFGTIWSRSGLRKTPWVNGDIQYDNEGNIYVWTNSSNFFQEITKFEFIKTSQNTMSIKTSIINLIGESYYFNYFVLPNGGIIYMHRLNQRDMIWKYRSTTGATTEIKELSQNNSLLINGIKYFESISADKCFLINDSKNKPILFLTGRNNELTNPPAYPINDTVQPFNIEIDANNQIYLKPITNSKFKFSYIPPNAPTDINLFEPCTLFSDYYHGMFYFKNGTNHIFTSRWGGMGFWWKYDDQTQKISTSFVPYSVQDFDTFNQLMTYSENNIYLPIRTSFYFINMGDLTWKRIENLNFQIFKTNYQGNEKVQFYGISYLNGKKVLGEIDKNGTVNIIKELEEGVEIRDLIRIGNF